MANIKGAFECLRYIYDQNTRTIYLLNSGLVEPQIWDQARIQLHGIIICFVNENILHINAMIG